MTSRQSVIGAGLIEQCWKVEIGEMLVKDIRYGSYDGWLVSQSHFARYRVIYRRAEVDQPPSLEAVIEYLKGRVARQQAAEAEREAREAERAAGWREAHPRDGEPFDFAVKPVRGICRARGRFTVGHLEEEGWKQKLIECDFFGRSVRRILRFEPLEHVLMYLAQCARQGGAIEYEWMFTLLQNLAQAGLVQLEVMPSAPSGPAQPG